MRRTAFAAVAISACLAFALAGCSSGSPAASSSSPENPTSVSAVSTSTDTPQEIQVVESGYSQTGDYWTYAVVIENPNKDMVAENIPVSITIKDEGGTVLYNTTSYVNYLFPLQKTAIVEDVVSLAGTPATIEAQATLRSDNWSSAEGIQGGDADTLFEVTGLAELDEGYDSFSYTGEVANGFDEAMTIKVSVLFRDDAGKLVGGVYTYTNDIPGGGKGAFQAYAFEPPAHATFEAYAMPAF